MRFKIRRIKGERARPARILNGGAAYPTRTLKAASSGEHHAKLGADLPRLEVRYANTKASTISTHERCEQLALHDEITTRFANHAVPRCTGLEGITAYQISPSSST